VTRCSAIAARVLAALAVLALAAPPAWAGAIDLQLVDPIDGKSVRVQSGSPLLHVVFFAVWCPPCVDELRELAEIDARWEQNGYRLVLVAVPERQSADRLQRFVQDREPPGELLLDSDGSVRSALRGAHLPMHLLFDATGRELLRSDSLDGVEAEIERLLLGGDGRAPGRR
jgi:thiol-disulfide isomerase/thioredoxin